MTTLYQRYHLFTKSSFGVSLCSDLLVMIGGMLFDPIEEEIERQVKFDKIIHEYVYLDIRWARLIKKLLSSSKDEIDRNFEQYIYILNHPKTASEDEGLLPSPGMILLKHADASSDLSLKQILFNSLNLIRDMKDDLSLMEGEYSHGKTIPQNISSMSDPELYQVYTQLRNKYHHELRLGQIELNY